MEFRYDTPAAAIEDLHRRLDATRWPEEVNDDAWSYGMRGDYLRRLVEYWRHEFDWPQAEARLNAFPQQRIDIDGLSLHFIHARSSYREATPLILTHGWPGSIVEFLDVLPRLTQPERYGGRAEDAFHVVAPSVQGYGHSPASPTGMGPTTIAKRHVQLMKALGYARYAVQGGDWGSLISLTTAATDPDACLGVHVNFLPPFPPKTLADPLAVVKPHEVPWLAAGRHYQEHGNGYYQLQRTRPQTGAFALNDSPAGWCAWVAEKFHFWTDCERDGVRDLRNAISWDALLTNVSLYWFTNTIASSMRLYREQALEAASGATWPQDLKVPMGVAVYPREISATPRAWAEHRFNIVHWFEASRGGHFAAMEQPQVFAEDLWAFGRTLRIADRG